MAVKYTTHTEKIERNAKKRKKIAIVAVVLIYIWTNKKNSFIVVDEP